MYEELVRRLRDSEHEIDCSLCDRDCCYPDGKVHGECIIIEAADAIEELSKRSECPCWYGGIRFCAMLGKPIPEPPKEESNGV